MKKLPIILQLDKQITKFINLATNPMFPRTLAEIASYYGDKYEAVKMYNRLARQGFASIESKRVMSMRGYLRTNNGFKPIEKQRHINNFGKKKYTRKNIVVVGEIRDN